MSGYDDDVDLDLDPYSSPRQKHGVWGSAGWVIAVIGIALFGFSWLFIVDDDPVGKIIGIIMCVVGGLVTAYGVSYMIRHRKPHYDQ